jgi:indole-3-glycerol phosphate synthase
MSNFLTEILEHKYREVRRQSALESLEDLQCKVAGLPVSLDFEGALRQPRVAGEVALIAEIKKASPSKGVLSADFHPVRIAREYEQGGAAALSVLTDRDFFQGSLTDLECARAAVKLPVLRKDFTLEEYHVLEAAASGADAILLIAALYEPEEMARYARLARGLGLVPLVETHDAEDIAKLGGEPWEMVGINNRDLRTFDVDLERSIALLAGLPAEAVKVAESGIRDGLDVALLSESGFDAFLIGETLLLAGDPAAKLQELLIGAEA